MKTTVKLLSKLIDWQVIKRAILLFTIFSFSSVAAPQVTPQQIEQFKKLSPNQQQAMAKSLGINLEQIKRQKSVSLSNEKLMDDALKPSFYPRGTTFDEFGNPIFEPELIEGDDKKSKKPQPFGYDVFANEPSTFSPNTNVAIPPGYIIGNGDVISLQVFGKENYDYQLPVNREGKIVIPSIGAYDVSGLTFEEMKNFLRKQITTSIIGVDAVVTLTELRSIRVFVVGDAYKPGPYTLSSLSTITHALFAAGGINDIGSLRNIQLKRQGKLIQTFDLYDLLIKGDSSSDRSLQSGDVIFIAPVGATVTVDGEVRRPAIYELAQNETFDDVIKMAGGLLPSAYPKTTIVERFNEKNLRTIIDIDLTNSKQSNLPVSAGDYIRVMKTASIFDKSVTIIGAVTRPGNYQWHENQRVGELFPNIDSYLLQHADLQYSLLVREIDSSRNIEVYQFSLSSIIEDQQSEDNLLLQPRDKIIIFSNAAKKSDEKLSLDSLAYTQEDLFEKEKELAKEKYQQQLFWEKYASDKSKYKIDEEDIAEKKQNELINQSIAQLTGGKVDEKLDIRELALFSRQRLLLPIISQLKRQSVAGQPVKLIEVDGEVKFPSIYPLAVNARVKDLITAAGGVTESAYLSRAEITRNVVNTTGVEKQSINVNLAKALQEDVKNNILLQSKDRLNVHKIPAWSENYTVELRGEFVFPGKYTIRRGETLSELIKKAGGLTAFAYAEGSVFSRQKLKELEQRNIIKLTSDLRLEIASKSLSDTKSNLSYQEAKQLLNDLTGVTPVGRLVIDLPKIINEGSYDVMLDDGDVLYIPSKTNSVNVIGQVQVTSSHIFEPNLSAEDYIARSGGLKKRADEERIYVISADGRIKKASAQSWFASSDNTEMKPGDTIVVPLDSEYMDNLTLWSTATQIIYNSAVAIAAISRI